MVKSSAEDFELARMTKRHANFNKKTLKRRTDKKEEKNHPPSTG